VYIRIQLWPESDILCYGLHPRRIRTFAPGSY